MKQKLLFSSFTHYSIYFICAIFYALSIDLSMPDDGLRHIAFAANQEIMLNWGNVYPHSLFTSYDPWFAWHFILKMLLNIISYDYIHIYINTFSFFILMNLIDMHIRKLTYYSYSSLLYIVVFIITMLVSFRYVMVRPDLLSGFYVMIALLLNNRFKQSFLLTILYAPFYYLFFIYTGAIALVYLVQKKWLSFFGVLIGSIFTLTFFLIHDFKGYTQTVINILTDQKLRMGLEVKEGQPILEIFSHMNYYILLPLFLIASILLIRWKYHYFKNNSVATFLLISSILWINQYRYYHLLLPLIAIFIFTIIINANKKSLLYLLRKYYTLTKRNFNYSKNKPIFYLIAIPYSILMLSYIFSSTSYNSINKEASFFKNTQFDNKVILLNKFNPDIFKAHYYNPSIKIIPSCSIGWFEENSKMKDIYIRMQKPNGITEKELSSLIKYVNADIYIHYFHNKKQILNFEKLKQFGIIPKKIYHHRIIFDIKKSDLQ